jgi:hypothetical protein
MSAIGKKMPGAIGLAGFTNSGQVKMQLSPKKALRKSTAGIVKRLKH